MLRLTQRETKALAKAKEKILAQANQFAPISTETTAEWVAISSQIYVPPEAERFGRAEPLSLAAVCQEFMASQEKRQFVLLGAPGAGKTTYLKHWYQQQRAIVAQGDGAWPLFIALNRALSDSDIRQGHILEDYLKNRVGLTVEEVNVVKGHQALLLFCDGYDEISDEGNLYQANHWGEWAHLKWVISSRPEKFGTITSTDALQARLLKSFSPIPVGIGAAIPASLRIYTMSGLRAEKVREYIRQWQALATTGWGIADYEQQIDKIPGLKELTCNPVILSLVLYALPSLAEKYADKTDIEQRHLQRIDVYAQFVQVWFESQVTRVMDKVREADDKKNGSQLLTKLDTLNFNWIAALLNYTKQLAYWSLLNGDMGRLALEIPAAQTCQRHLLDDPERGINLSDQLTEREQGILLLALRSGCLLRCESAYFKFFHKSLIEYFAQSHIFGGTIGQLNLAMHEINSEVEPLNTQIAEPNLLRMLAEQVRGDETNNLRDRLIALIQESRAQRDLAFAASNAITILNYAKEPLSTIDWSGVRIPGADLSKALLHMVNFRGADLSWVHFDGAYLAGADLRETNLQGCHWGFKPIRRFQAIITALVYTPDNHWLVVGDEKGHLHFIHRASGLVAYEKKHYWYFQATSDAVTCLAVSGDVKQPGQWLASGSEGGDIYLWSLANHQYQGKLPSQASQAAIRALAFHPTETTLASAQGNHIYLWDITRKRVLRILSGHTDTVRCLAYSPDGSQLASGSGDSTIRLWAITDAHAPSCVLSGHTHTVTCLAYSPDGLQLASGSDDNTLRLWAITDELAASRALGGHANRVSCLAYSPDGLQLASGSDDSTLRLWAIMDEHVAGRALRGHKSTITSLTYSPDGLQLASGSEDSTLRLWSITDAHATGRALREHTDTVSCLAYSPDGLQLASGSVDNTLRLWTITDAHTASRELSGHTNTVTCLAYSPDGLQLASGSWDNTIQLWALTDAHAASRELHRHTDAVTCLAYSPDGLQLASGSYDRTIRLWAITDAHAPSRELRGHTDTVWCLTYSPDGLQLASGSWDNTIRLWALTDAPAASRELKGHTDGVTCLAYSPDGLQLASGSWDNTIRLWALTDAPAASRELKGHTDGVTCLAYSPDGLQLASSSGDYTIRLWDSQTGGCLQVIEAGCVIYAFHWQIRNENDYLQAAGAYGEKIQHFVCEVTEHSAKLLTCLDESLLSYLPCYQHMAIHQATGIPKNKYRFLALEGAIGEPKLLLDIAVNETILQEEDRELKKLIRLKDKLQQRRECQQQAKSLFDNSYLISYQVWMIYLLRVGLPYYGVNASYCDSRSNRHVYGLLEGLNQLGQRVLIRFDLVQDKTNERYARVKVKTDVIDNEETKSRAGFMGLFEGSRQANPELLIGYHSGSLGLKAILTLIDKIIQEQSRQSPQQRESERIRYRFFGGNDSQRTSHNCLTWLRHVLSDYNDLSLPRAALEALYVDPASALPERASFFSRLPVAIRCIDTSKWHQASGDEQHRPGRKH